jgi:uncharacterized membrane protein YccC
MTFKLKRIWISLKSAYRFCLNGYWGDSVEGLIGFLMGLGLLGIFILKLIFFIPYMILDILFSIIVAPFMKAIDLFDEDSK